MEEQRIEQRIEKVAEKPVERTVNCTLCHKEVSTYRAKLPSFEAMKAKCRVHFVNIEHLPSCAVCVPCSRKLEVQGVTGFRWYESVERQMKDRAEQRRDEARQLKVRFGDVFNLNLKTGETETPKKRRRRKKSEKLQGDNVVPLKKSV